MFECKTLYGRMCSICICNSDFEEHCCYSCQGICVGSFVDDPANCKSHVGGCDPKHCAPWCGLSNQIKCFESNLPPDAHCCDKTGECHRNYCPYNCDIPGTKMLAPVHLYPRTLSLRTYFFVSNTNINFSDENIGYLDEEICTTKACTRAGT